MSRTEQDCNPIEIVMETLTEQGFGGMAQANSILLDEAMKLERDSSLGSKLYERTPGRRARANGFKANTVKTRIGEIPLRIPQVRDADEPFYPQAI